jgi:hypothetical protein
MKTSDRICQEARGLPEHLAREVLDFIGYLKSKESQGESHIENLKQAQTTVMQGIWDNVEDEVWDDM